MYSAVLLKSCNELLQSTETFTVFLKSVDTLYAIFVALVFNRYQNRIKRVSAQLQHMIGVFIQLITYTYEYI